MHEDKTRPLSGMFHSLTLNEDAECYLANYYINILFYLLVTLERIFQRDDDNIQLILI